MAFQPALLLLDCGDRAFRGYAMRSLAELAAPVVLFASSPTRSWARDYVDAIEIVDLSDLRAVLAAAQGLGDRFRIGGVMTWNDRVVELCAWLAGQLGLPGPPLAGVTACKDKSQLRSALAGEVGLSVAAGVAHTLEDAVEVAQRFGFPVVLKPRGLGGSAGVVVARDRGELRSAFTTAATCTIGGRSSLYPGVLVEEFLDGAEYSVDSLTVDGCTHPLVVAEKRLGFAPYFEETGHVVAAAIPPELADGLELVRRAHQVIGLDRLITHSEFRLTSGGPRLIEINARLGGDLIPHLGQLATGVDFVSLGAQAALGLTRTWEPRDGGCAAIRFFYPPHDMDFHSVQLAGGAADHAGLVSFAAAAEPGERLLLPPRDFAARAAYAIVTGAEPSACEAALDRIAGCVEIRGAAVGDSVVAGV